MFILLKKPTENKINLRNSHTKSIAQNDGLFYLKRIKMEEIQNLVETTKNYYNSHDADEFYHSIWGGEDIHVGIYNSEDEEITTASRRTVEKMVEILAIHSETKVLDIGSGYGGSARFLAKNFNCSVTCLNLSEAENTRNLQKTKEQGLEKLIKVVEGNFEQLPFEDNQFDLIWSQDAILHSGKKEKVFQEVNRVLKSEGKFIFTDPMQSDDCPEGVLQPILDRIHLESLGFVKFYKELANQNNWKVFKIIEMPEQLTQHYDNVLTELIKRENELKEKVSFDYITRMKAGLNHWVEGGKKGYLNWGILYFEKP